MPLVRYKAVSTKFKNLLIKVALNYRSVKEAIIRVFNEDFLTLSETVYV